MSRISVYEQFERALRDILARVSVSGPAVCAVSEKPALRMAIAYSGGLDSSALLHMAKQYASGIEATLFAFHVHHGLSKNANAWLAHCEHECKVLGIRFEARRIQLSEKETSNVEESARIRRYGALGELCRAHDVDLLLTAHHLDDQAETVLLQLLRGSGIAGMSGMEGISFSHGLLGVGRIKLARPLLDISRAALEEYVAACSIVHIHDESNQDSRYTRNALRNEVLPVLAKHFPAFRQSVVRTAAHARAANSLLLELAAEDFHTCVEDECINLARAREMGDHRINNLFRYWFKIRGVRMPSMAWIEEMRRQVMCAAPDAQVRVIHPDVEVRRHRERLYLVRRHLRTALPEASRFEWKGEAVLHFPAFGGALHFLDSEEGFDAEWLQRQPLQIRIRLPGDRMKLARNRPSRDLKHHYQAFDIPVWMRERLPQICASGDLIFSVGLGADCRYFSESTASRIMLRWVPDTDFKTDTSRPEPHQH
ncbi:MAG: putative tRNA(Ile)-lysidine synthase ((Ile)-lysidine synthetase) (Ile)-2-lysyl-cytidine [Paucimonas sp.]|jgi:tRNA(Ile)-lysidine synthase|nr:putative tRNA(Ile)-lysidine synthase ((Ile)-lysidine synthetase) (Ile)-2-lysyl-cytidine [Paucimonas sp.]